MTAATTPAASGPPVDSSSKASETTAADDPTPTPTASTLGPVTSTVPPNDPGSSGDLANTGFDAAWTLTLGAGLLAFGAGVLLLVRRRA